MADVSRFIRRESRRPIDDFWHRIRVGAIGALIIMVGIGGLQWLAG